MKIEGREEAEEGEFFGVVVLRRGALCCPLLAIVWAESEATPPASDQPITAPLLMSLEHTKMANSVSTRNHTAPRGRCSRGLTIKAAANDRLCVLLGTSNLPE